MHPTLFDSRQNGTRQSFKALLSRSTLLFARIVSEEINTTQKKTKKENCIQKKKREKNIRITIYVLIYFIGLTEITDFSHEQGCQYLVFFVFTTSFINQWASRIITLTFLPKSVDDESAL
jgi:hypothetical protein